MLEMDEILHLEAGRVIERRHSRRARRSRRHLPEEDAGGAGAGYWWCLRPDRAQEQTQFYARVAKRLTFMAIPKICPPSSVPSRPAVGQQVVVGRVTDPTQSGGGPS